MTVTIKTKQIDGYVISIEQDKFSTAYGVRAARMIDDSNAVDVDRKLYGTIEQARRRFNTLCRRVQDGGTI